jgi:hypothetical protein
VPPSSAPSVRVRPGRSVPLNAAGLADSVVDCNRTRGNSFHVDAEGRFAAQASTALIIYSAKVDIVIGQEYRVDVSSEEGTRVDQNITGFRAEEEFGFNAEPYV